MDLCTYFLKLIFHVDSHIQNFLLVSCCQYYITFIMNYMLWIPYHALTLHALSPSLIIHWQYIIFLLPKKSATGILRFVFTATNHEPGIYAIFFPQIIQWPIKLSFLLQNHPLEFYALSPTAPDHEPEIHAFFPFSTSHTDSICFVFFPKIMHWQNILCFLPEDHTLSFYALFPTINWKYMFFFLSQIMYWHNMLPIVSVFLLWNDSC